jgi:hypothetical protein
MKYGIRTSPAQFMFYFVWLFVGAITTRSAILRKMDDNSQEFYAPATDRVLIFYAIQYGLAILLFTLNCFADAEPKKFDEQIKLLKNPCPQVRLGNP